MRIRPPHAPNSFYHVTLRGVRQQPIFCDRHDRHRWQGLLSEALSRFGARLHLYCWMTNHVHMVLECGDIPICKTLHLAAGAYARIFNAKYTHVGHVFQARYGSRLIDTDAYLLHLINYIHINPVEAGIVAAPMEYPWSSCRSYALAIEPAWLTTAFILALFSDDPETARARMAAFTNTAAASVDIALSRVGPNIDDLAAQACRRYSVDESLLIGPSKRRNLCKARAWVAWMAHRSGTATLADVAKRFNRHPSVLLRSLAQYKLEFDGSSST